MNDTKESIIKFSEAFFSSLKCTLSWKEDCLIVNNIPKNFEEFFGKKGPYTLVFEQIPDKQGELMIKGSFLLKAMADFLERSGQATLIKLDFERNYSEELKHHFKLYNSEITNFKKEVENKIIIRFTFQTNLQYLNEKEQFINTLFIKERRVINFNLDKYKSKEGNHEEVKKFEFKEEYEKAKSELRNLLEFRIKKTSELLKSRLEKEKERIREHYKKLNKETENSLIKQKESISNLEKQSEKSTEEEKVQIRSKIKRIQDSILASSNSHKAEKLKKEESFFINDEVHKHSLNINNKLINTTLIYYPVFTFRFILKSKDSGRHIIIEYEPYEETITKLNCESCNREIKDLFICSSGHLSCANCAELCKECERGLCLKCTKKECSLCGKPLCKKCFISCSTCSKSFCSLHSKKDYISDKISCTKCLKKCSICAQYTSEKNMKKNSLGKLTCLKCHRLNLVNKTILNRE